MPKQKLIYEAQFPQLGDVLKQKTYCGDFENVIDDHEYCTLSSKIPAGRMQAGAMKLEGHSFQNKLYFTMMKNNFFLVIAQDQLYSHLSKYVYYLKKVSR